MNMYIQNVHITCNFPAFVLQFTMIILITLVTTSLCFLFTLSTYKFAINFVS